MEDGGRGGHVYLVGNKGLGHYFTLNLRVTSKLVMVEMGGDRSTGADGDDKHRSARNGKRQRNREYYLKLPKMVKTNYLAVEKEV
jgi:GTP-binding protein